MDVPFITSLGVGAHLEAFGVPPERITELDWWESWRSPKAELAITAAPSQHFSGRGLKDRNATLWSSMVIETPRHKVFFSGDTGLTTEYESIRERFGRFDLVMLEVGAFHPSWGDIHLGPENALKALELLGGGAFMNRKIVGYHQDEEQHWVAELECGHRQHMNSRWNSGPTSCDRRGPARPGVRGGSRARPRCPRDAESHCAGRPPGE